MEANVYVNKIYYNILKGDRPLGLIASFSYENNEYISFGYTENCRETLVDTMGCVQNLLLKTDMKPKNNEPSFFIVIDEGNIEEYKKEILVVAQNLFNNRMSWRSATIGGDCLYISGKKFIEVGDYSIVIYYYPDINFFYKRDTPILSLFIFLVRNVSSLKGRILPENIKEIFNILDRKEKNNNGYYRDDDDEFYNDDNEDYDFLSAREVLLSIFGYWMTINYFQEFNSKLIEEGFYYNGIASFMFGFLGDSKRGLKRFLEFVEFIDNPNIPEIHINWFDEYFTVQQAKKLIGG